MPYPVQACNSSSAILSDDHRFVVCIEPCVQISRKASLDGLRMARVLVPAVVTVDAYHVHKLCLNEESKCDECP